MKRFNKVAIEEIDTNITFDGEYYIIKARPIPVDKRKPSKTGKTITVFATGGHVWKETPEQDEQFLGYNLTISLTLPKEKPEDVQS